MKKFYKYNQSGIRKKVKNCCFFLLLFTAILSTNQTAFAQTTDTYTTSGSWTVPAGVSSVTVQIWGAGGGGGGSNTNKAGGSGGGSGAYVIRVIPVTPGTYAFTIGTGGTGGGAAAGTGGTGGNSSITIGGFTLTANGGTGGEGNEGNPGTGGVASGGTTNTNGNDGIDGSNTGNFGANGGDAPNGGAGGVAGSDGPGGPGGTPGAGGGGGEQGAGGAGARGEIRFTYTAPNPCTSAINLPCGTTNLAGTTVGSTNYTHGTGCSMSNYGAWYTFVGNGDMTTITTTPGFDIKLSVATGSCGSLTNIACTDSSPESATFTTVNGTTYYVYIAHWQSGSTTTGTFTISRSCSTPPPALTNDNCSGAIPLTVNTSCSFSTFSNAGATASAGVTAPGCSSYTGGDIWFSAIVPANGILTIDTQTGVITDGGMAWYTGTCGALTLLECDDDDSNNGLMPMITRTGLTPGSTIYIRVWEYGNDNNGTFGICATSPGACVTPAQATGFTPGVITSTTLPASFSGTASNYLVILSTSATPPSQPQPGIVYNAANIGTLGAGLTFVQNGTSTTIAGTGLNANTRYYYYIYAYNNTGCTGGPLYAVGSLTGNGVTCPITPGTVTTSSTLTTILLNWASSLGGAANAVSYQIQVTTDAGYTANIAGSPFTVNDPTTSLNITGLTANTLYYYRIRAFNGCYSTYTSGTAVTGYCQPAPTSVDGTGITNVTIAPGINNTTGAEAGNYGNYSAQVTTGMQGETKNFSIQLNTNSWAYALVMWVDWNNDLDFNDAGETVYAGSTPATNPATLNGSFIIPSNASLGNHRIRIGAADSATPTPCYNGSYATYEDYTVSVSAAPCAGPTSITGVATSLTTATISWTAASPEPANGYQYYYSTSSTAPTAGTTPSGSTPFSVETANLSGMTSGVTYYVWVRSNCGGGLGQGFWIGPLNFYQPNCLPGGGNGTSALACPSVISGGLGLNGADPAAITCASASSCVSLEADYLQLGQTTTYTVESIPYNPPYQFGCLQNPVSVNDDDVWSPIVNLPFNFCYYGNTYDSCVIGSNGTLTFDTTKANTLSGYSFSNNLPSTTGSLFANTIYGVYHDIDPREGGEVGWELITLNSGCRALVASWSNVPMFSNNSLLYTGMMVLYENTNVIEVYIKEKNIDGTWNGGNAIVGVQNATGTQAVVAPGRNGLDADWTATNQAWRFVPAGTSITSIKWYEGSGTSGPVVGNTDVINVCPPNTTIYTAEVTYTLCNGTTLKETEETTVTVSANKTWNGSAGTNWNTAANWTPAGVPVATEGVLIPNTVNKPVITGGAAAVACSLSIQSGATLTVDPANTITVTNAVNIAAGGDMIIENTGSLVQTNNVANTGTAHIKRTSQPMYVLDYTYWNSPVTAASGFTVGNLTSGTNKIYKYTPTVANGSGTWAQIGTATVMNPTFGVIARAPGTFPSTGPKQTYTVNFTGTPNNGPITMPIAMGTNANLNSTIPSSGSTAVTDADDEWNLIGNPYPSAVNIINFLNHPSNIPVVDGTVYLWTHNTPPATATPDPFYGNYVLNYTASDYATINSTGATTTVGGTATPTQYLASGQSFFISAETNGNVTFENSMRVLNNNANFYRDSNESESANGFQSQRLWLNLSNNNGGFSQTLVGYVEGATLAWDRGFDGEALAGNAVKFYSLGADKKLTIQGRPWPFAQEDIVPLGFKATAQGNYTIGIDHFDASFNDSNIYLEDKSLNLIHNLKVAPYSFTSTVGTFDNRFVLRYTENTLSNEDNSVIENSVVIYANEKLRVNSTLEPIKEIVVYDVLGRLLLNGKKVNANEFTANTLNPTNSTLIVKVTLENNTVITRKVIY